MTEHEFEHDLARRLRADAEHGLRPFDALEIARLAMSSGGRAGVRAVQPRGGLPVWFRSFVLAGLLVVLLIAAAIAGGLIRLPSIVVDPSPSPTTAAILTPSPIFTIVPGPTDQPGPTGEPIPTGEPGPTPSGQPNGEPSPTAVPTIAPTPGATPLPTPFVSPTAVATDAPPSASTVPQGVVVGVGVGDLQTCALRADGRVFCFGPNSMGELGDGTTTDRYSADVPVVGLTDARQVTGGIRFTCALRTTGRVACWGEGGSGQLGNRSTSNSSVPVAVAGLRDATQVVAGGTHVCALRANGQVACWGSANKVGNGSPTNSSEPVSTPVEVNGLSDAVQIAAGWNHTCARRAGGSIACWGLNGDGATGYGGLGDGTFDHAATPVEVVGIDDARSVAAGGWSTCAIRSDSSVWCWGFGERGGLGDGNSTNSSTPVRVSGIDDAGRITVGGWHACALVGSQRARCWGANSWGQTVNQLGDGTGVDRATPVDVINVPGLAQIQAAWIHTVGITPDGRLWLWGWSAGGGGRNPGEIIVSGAAFE